MSYCKKCAHPIIWRTEDGKWMPYDEDGTCHFKTCVPNKNAEKILSIMNKRRSAKPKNKLQIGEDEFI